ncbi:hypothetical protein RVN83_36830 [Streptomyces sp. PU10]|uniref:hypothetical protein n=1 Tax=Streptomyces sp. PU10 TaxID=3062780 RepID=UPI0028FC7651|nr:hypothetical protein [Streptomyces sp. PU10]MDU0258487.1 hypothetical protein [Streptomyces sp. PU10]
MGSAHRVWLDPMRTAYLASGLTLNELDETLELFTAISRLPVRQLDVIVLRRLCGFTHEAAPSALLGAFLATIRSDERHATRFLDSVTPHPAPKGRTTALGSGSSAACRLSHQRRSSSARSDPELVLPSKRGSELVLRKIGGPRGSGYGCELVAV